MAGKKSKDPVQNAVAALEDKVNVLGRAVFGSSRFGAVMNTAVSTQARVKKGFSGRMAKNLNFYNIPSQDDVIQLAEQCARIEERLVTIESLLHKLTDANTAPPRKGPARTRKPKSASAAKKPKTT